MTAVPLISLDPQEGVFMLNAKEKRKLDKLWEDDRRCGYVGERILGINQEGSYFAQIRLGSKAHRLLG